MENLTCFSFLDLLDCMNLLLGNLSTIKIGNEEYNTQDLIGRAPISILKYSNTESTFTDCYNYSTSQVPRSPRIIKIASKTNTQSFIEKQDEICPLTADDSLVKLSHLDISGDSQSVSCDRVFHNSVKASITVG